MLSALYKEEWLVPSYSFKTFGDMESEIAELRTLTKVTKLRQQIECKQEGAWLMVRDIPDDKSKSGTRKVTSYGRASRSLTRSFSQSITGNSIPFEGIDNSNVIVEDPPDITEERDNNSNKSVEIVEVVDEPSQMTPDSSQIQSLNNSNKKTSVITLGKGNLVLINDEDANFQVTGISKGRVAEAVNTLERVAQGEKKVKKVGFCKTEVHFAPDSGRVKIVETDEKPPPTQILRKKKKPRIKNIKSDLPKLYFGNPPSNDGKDNSQCNINEGLFPVIIEPSPSLTISNTNITSKKDATQDHYGYIRKVLPSSETSKSEDKSSFNYFGNVSPKLSKLLQNNMQHEFQAKQKQIMKTKESSTELNKNLPCETTSNKPMKIVTQVSLGVGRGEVEHKLMLRSNNKTSEPIYINEDANVLIKNTNTNKSSTTTKDKIPKPRPRTTIVLSPQVKEVRNAKLVKQPEKQTKKVSPKPKDICQSNNKPAYKHCSRSPSCKSEKYGTNLKLQKLIKSGPTQDKPPEPRVRKTREPLRSFEKVSNGWVGHCITPIKTSDIKPRETQVTVTTKIPLNKAAHAVSSSHTQGPKRGNVSSGVKNLRSSTEIKTSNKSLLTENKQFSLSKEHLRSAKLVKELSNKEKQGVSDLRMPKKHISNATVTNVRTREVTPHLLNSRPPARVGVVKPRIVQQSNSSNKNGSVAVRIALPRSEHSLRQRRDSEQSDDSVVRADEEVRAYMFNTRHKENCFPFNVAVMEEMTASYTEICDSGGQELSTPRPTVLELPGPQAEFLNQLDGTVTRHGDMISFVAGDLEAKIKLSSPPSVSRQEPFFGNQVTLVEELEAEACVLAASVDSLAEALSETLHGISALTVDCLETYRDVVCKACDSIDNNIKAMYQLMAKCEEMSKSMQHVHKLAAHIKNIKHLLDIFESLPS